MERHEGEINAELLNEAVADDEVRELIKRLHVDWASVGAKATIGDVAEATGQEPRRVATLLAEIRRETFEAEFRRTFGVHGEKIQTLEAKTGHLEQKTSRMEEMAFGGDAEIVEDLVRVERQRREAAPITLLVFIILAAFAFLAIQRVLNRPGSAFPGFGTGSQQPTWSVQQTATDGATLRIDANENMSATMPDGTRRELTEEERVGLIQSFIYANKR